MQTGGLLLFAVPSCSFPWLHATYNQPQLLLFPSPPTSPLLGSFRQLWAESAFGKKAEETIDLASQGSTVSCLLFNV